MNTDKIIFFLILFLFFVSIFASLSTTSFFRRLICLGMVQTSVLIFFVLISYISDGIAPVLIDDKSTVYVNPLPHVLMLTAIVVGFATLSVGLAIIIRMKKFNSTISRT